MNCDKVRYKENFNIHFYCIVFFIFKSVDITSIFINVQFEHCIYYDLCSNLLDTKWKATTRILTRKCCLYALYVQNDSMTATNMQHFSFNIN